MAVIQQDKRRLQALYRQLYIDSGSNNSKKVRIDQKEIASLKEASSPKISDRNISYEYVKQDLLRILILSSIAITAQLLLYFASIRNLISLNLI